MLEDMIIGTVVDRAGESYYLEVNSSSRAQLPKLAFDGASKRNKPNLQLGALVYCRVVLANKELEPEVTCCSLGKKKDWVTREGVFGELLDGYLFDCSLALCRQLLADNCLVLKLLGDKIGYECAIGMNGKVWVKANKTEDTILIANAIQNSEFLTPDQVKAMVAKMLSTVNVSKK